MALDAWVFDPNNTTGFPIGAMTYREMDNESGEATFGETNASARRVFLVDWDQANDFISDLLGYATIGGGFTNVNRVLPESHPEFPLYATTAKRIPVTPSRVNAGISEWTLAKIDTGFREVDYFVLPNDVFQFDELYRFVSRRTIPKGDYLQLATNTFSWTSRPVGQSTALGAVPGIIVPARTLEYTWRMIPAIPLAAGDANAALRPPTEAKILALLGTANSVVFDSIYPVGTVLFTAAEATLIPPRFNNLYHWQIKYYFEVKDHSSPLPPTLPVGTHAGVNYLYDPVNNWWDVVKVPASGRTLYQDGNLNSLFAI